MATGQHHIPNPSAPFQSLVWLADEAAFEAPLDHPKWAARRAKANRRNAELRARRTARQAAA